jgi:kynurenine formamidase
MVDRLVAKMTHNQADIPAYDELPLKAGVPCSWGLWGEDDKLGALNLLTPERALAAVTEVKRGVVFPLDWDWALPYPPLFERRPLVHHVVAVPNSRSHDDWLDDWNPSASTQWDGFRHVRREGYGNYNGIDNLSHGVGYWADKGLVGRGVLADAASWRAEQGRPLDEEAPDPITVADIEATLASQGVSVEPGDVLFVRTGWIEWYLAQGEEKRKAISTMTGLFTPGLDPTEDMARYLWNLHVSAVAADNPALEPWPLGFKKSPEELAEIMADPGAREHEVQLHTHLLPMLGIPIGELFFLEDLAADCRETGQWSFMLTSSPMHLRDAVASPPNALAIK